MADHLLIPDSKEHAFFSSMDSKGKYLRYTQLMLVEYYLYNKLNT